MTEQMGVPNENRRDAAELVVAIVPALNRGDSVAATVRALRELDRVGRVVVVDDGSSDDTATVAQAAGADVVQLARNRGKGAAVAAGVAAAPEADVILLIDADLAATAGAVDRLLDPVLAGEADLAIGVLPPAGSRGGFGRSAKSRRPAYGEPVGSTCEPRSPANERCAPSSCGRGSRHRIGSGSRSR